MLSTPTTSNSTRQSAYLSTCVPNSLGARHRSRPECMRAPASLEVVVVVQPSPAPPLLLYLLLLVGTSSINFCRSNMRLLLASTLVSLLASTAVSAHDGHDHSTSLEANIAAANQVSHQRPRSAQQELNTQLHSLSFGALIARTCTLVCDRVSQPPSSLDCSGSGHTTSNRSTSPGTSATHEMSSCTLSQNMTGAKLVCRGLPTSSTMLS